MPRLFCGERCGAALANYVPDSSSSRTWPTSSPSAGSSSTTDAYVAGLIDGEGCIYIGKADLRPRVEIAMSKAENLLKGLQAEYGGRVRLQKTHSNRADLHRWVAYGRTATTVLKRVGPYLRLKEEQAKLVLDACEIYEALRPRADDTRHWTPTARREIDAIRLLIVALNRRGPIVEPVLPAAGRFVKPQSSLLAPFGEPFSQTWPRSGSMTSDGTVYPLVPSAPRTSVTGFSALLATPRCADGMMHPIRDAANVRDGNPRGRLEDQVAMLLPTPASADAERQSATYGRGNPTPRGACESTGATTNPPSPNGKPSTDKLRLRLSPEFVGWMMGTPSCSGCGREWTDPDCPHSAMAFMSTSDGSSVST